MHNLEMRERWDTNIKKSFKLKQVNRLGLIYILNKGAAGGVQKRDFYEKKLNFKVRSRFGDHKTYYFYFSSIENDVSYIEMSCKVIPSV